MKIKTIQYSSKIKKTVLESYKGTAKVLLNYQIKSEKLNKHSCSGHPSLKSGSWKLRFPNSSCVINRTCQYPMSIM